MSKWKDERALVLDVIAEAMNKQHWRCPTYGLLTLWVNIFFKLLYPLWVRGSIITANIIQIHIPPPTIHFPKINQSSLLKLHITSCYFAAYVSPMASHPFQNTTETPTCLQKLTWSDLFFPSWPTFFFFFFLPLIVLPSFGSSNMVGFLLSWGLCMSSSLSQECFSLVFKQLVPSCSALN